jgi:NAD(P)-dependent dehydrogenase (short-subunit alcohol dehydrogenase family)
VLRLIAFHFSGIGLESSILFAQEGATVLLVDVNNEAVERATEIIRQKQPAAKVLAIRADVGQEADVKAAVDTAIKNFGRLDVMVLPIILYPLRCSKPIPEPVQ